MNERNTFWNQAAKAGLVLGGVSVAYLALTYLLSLVNGEGFVLILMSIIKALLWVAKLFGCIYLTPCRLRKGLAGLRLSLSAVWWHSFPLLFIRPSIWRTRYISPRI